MNYPRTVLTTCAWMMFFGVSSFAAAQTAPIKQDDARNPYGRIHFNNDKGEEKCTLAIPATSQIFNFGASNQYCENNMVSTFWLENIPSATLIQFYENESCSDAKTDDNFFFKLKTVKQPTEWSSATMSIDELRRSSAGELIPKKNTRVEDAHVGSYFATRNLNERLSCVYIERSQPVN
ncbi:hypothetical protein [Pseudomonas sp. T1.Ur]|uniref:hypothetical protein n=1 Tax=Pseudomonas sp. T1.Ur TaxID=2928704 RepID=UPI00201E10E4|nr:hypothetical protein [Pseudomonas sp. T1.Ur]MCL6703293.1 hypothetical protein [Pseudomonas sp. T1.Ur]